MKRFFPCTTLAIGAARVVPGTMRHAEEVANAAALAKHEAKGCASGLAWRTAEQAAHLAHAFGQAPPRARQGSAATAAASA